MRPSRAEPYGGRRSEYKAAVSRDALLTVGQSVPGGAMPLLGSSPGLRPTPSESDSAGAYPPRPSRKGSRSRHPPARVDGRPRRRSQVGKPGALPQFAQSVAGNLRADATFCEIETPRTVC